LPLDFGFRGQGERVTRWRGLADRLLQDYSEASISRIFHTVEKEIELPVGAAVAMFRSPLPFEFVPVCRVHGIDLAATHFSPFVVASMLMMVCIWAHDD
jgi:hypothetical protein